MSSILMRRENYKGEAFASLLRKKDKFLLKAGNLFCLEIKLINKVGNLNIS
jgi:hypothetical protein